MTVFLAVSVLAILVLPGLEAASPRLIHSSILARPSILASPSLDRPCHPWLLVPRGGDGSDDVDNESDEEGEEEEDEEEEEVEIDVEYDEEEDDDVAMVKSAVKATEKLQAKKTAVTKKEVSAKLSAPKKKGPSLMKRYVPYIVRACLTPAILFAMTKAYFQSLFNLDFLAEVCLLCDCHVDVLLWLKRLIFLSFCICWNVGFVTGTAVCVGRKGQEIRIGRWWT